MTVASIENDVKQHLPAENFDLFYIEMPSFKN